MAEANLFEIERGPYLSMGTDSSMTVTFEVNISTNASIIYGVSSSFPSIADTIHETEFELHHSFFLSGLSPDTRYSYKVITLDDESPVYSFYTAPESPEAFSFCAYGDNRNNDWVHDSICAMMHREEPKLVLNSGDIVDLFISPSDWQDFFDCITILGACTPYWAAIGNHDTGFAFQLDFFEYPGNERYFSFDWSFVHFVCIHIYEDYSPGSDQYNFIYDDISSVPDSHYIIVFFHEPPYSSGNHGDNFLVQSNLVPLLDDLNVDIVIAGHDHSYEHLYKDDIHYIVTGGGGAPLYSVGVQDGTIYSESCYHYLRFDVRREILCAETVRIDGEIIDEFCIMPLGIDDLDNYEETIPFEIVASPNPFRDLLNISIKSSLEKTDRLPLDPAELKVTLTDLAGHELVTWRDGTDFTFYNGLNLTFDPMHLNSGIYLVKLNYKSMQITEKVILAK